MIDWWLVGSAAVWILGAAIVLAAFSYYHWIAYETSRPLRDVLRQRSWQIASLSGLMLFCVGFAVSPDRRWWERTVWILLAISFAWQALRVKR